ncbi:MAG: hypothetical protein GY795_11295 [Desulfobacterales bacterium]|nr:hypothetical protein [Desulfobacterales bacterium]
MRIKLSVSKTALIMFLAVSIGLFALTGCSDDDDNSISVCNQDNEEYAVRLYHENGELADDFNLGEWYDFSDLCDKFKNVATGWYYITIDENGSTASVNSENFYMASDTSRSFWITSSGNIETSDEGIIRVCNGDDEQYDVVLRSESGAYIKEFRLEEFYDVTNTCDNFENVPNGSYYITIHEDGAVTPADTSDVFVYDGAADSFFSIDSTGGIEKN